MAGFQIDPTLFEIIIVCSIKYRQKHEHKYIRNEHLFRFGALLQFFVRFPDFRRTLLDNNNNILIENAERKSMGKTLTLVNAEESMIVNNLLARNYLYQSKHRMYPDY